MQRLAAALLAVGVLALAWLLFRGGPPPRLEGRVTEVRTLEVEPEASVALVNFEAVNASRHLFVAYERRLEIVDAEGKVRRGQTTNKIDLPDLFRYFPELGGMRDEPFGAKTEIPAGATVRGLIGARFEISKAALDARQALVIRVVDGVGTETVLRDPPE